MRIEKRLALLLALILLLGLIPAGTMEEVYPEDGVELTIEAADLTDEAGPEDGADLPIEIIEPEREPQQEIPEIGETPVADDGAVDISGVEANSLLPYSNADTSLVKITKPADGGTVNTGTIDVWCRFVNPDPSGFSRDDVWKYLGVNWELLKSGKRIDLGVLNSYSGLVFVDDGLKVGTITIKSPGSYTLRASVPGSPDVWDSVDFKVIGATITPEPTSAPTTAPTVTPTPTPEPVITTDGDGFGVDQMGVLREYTGNAKDVTIPKSVTAIGEYAFHSGDIKSITFHSGVTKILEYAFGDAGALTTVNFAEGLKTIEDGAFLGSGLKKLVLPGTVTTIGSAAFHQCASLTSAFVPAGVETVGGYLFSLSENLKTVKFEKGSKIRKFKTDMFYGDKALENVTLPDALEQLGSYAFTNCTSLKSLTLPDTLTTILNHAFEGCTGLTELVIPETVKTMEADTFKGCTNLTLVVTEGSYAEEYAVDLGLAHRTISKATPKPTATPAPTAAPQVKLSKCTASVKAQVYTGKALKPAVTVKYGKKTLKKGTDYTLKYTNNIEVGTATVTVKGKGEYTGTKKLTFAVNPRSTALSKVTAGKGAFTARWKKRAEAGGYQIEYSLKKDFSGGKKVKAAKADTLSRTVKKLTAKKKYWVRVRTYKKVGKKTYWSAWSKPKAVTVK